MNSETVVKEMTEEEVIERLTKHCEEHGDAVVEQEPRKFRLVRGSRARRRAQMNASCPCGSGKKFKNCCLPKE